MGRCDEMASDVAELQFMAQKDENIKTSDDEFQEEAEENKIDKKLMLKNLKEEVTEPPEEEAVVIEELQTEPRGSG